MGILCTCVHKNAHAHWTAMHETDHVHGQSKVLHPKQCSTFGASDSQGWNTFLTSYKLFLAKRSSEKTSLKIALRETICKKLKKCSTTVCGMYMESMDIRTSTKFHPAGRTASGRKSTISIVLPEGQIVVQVSYITTWSCIGGFRGGTGHVPPPPPPAVYSLSHLNGMHNACPSRSRVLKANGLRSFSSTLGYPLLEALHDGRSTWSRSTPGRMINSFFSSACARKWKFLKS